MLKIIDDLKKQVFKSYSKEVVQNEKMRRLDLQISKFEREFEACDFDKELSKAIKISKTLQEKYDEIAKYKVNYIYEKGLLDGFKLKEVCTIDELKEAFQYE